MLTFFLISTICKNSYSTTPDQKNLTIIGNSEITQEDTRDGILYEQIEYVIIGDKIPKIGKFAFYEFSSLLEVHIPSSVVELGEHSFAYCKKLHKITFSEGLQTIGYLALSYVNSLKELRIPASVSYINFFLFVQSATYFNYFEVAEGNEKYSTDENHQFLLSKDKHTAFCCVYSPDSLVLPSSVEILSTYFASSRLSDLKFYADSNLTTINKHSFRKSKIKVLNLPSKVKTIHSESFWMSSLEEIRLPASLSDLSSTAFGSLSYLRSVDIDEANPYYKSFEGVIYDVNKTKLVFITPLKTTLSLPSTIVEISETAIQTSNVEYASVEGSKVYSSYEGIIYKGLCKEIFACPGKLKEAKIHRNCTKILKNAFRECSLTNITFEGNNVKSIDYMSFFCCKNLTYFPFEDLPIECIDVYSFSEAKSLKGRFKFNKKLNTLKEASFSSSAITEADFSECSELSLIYVGAFSNSDLSEIVLPPNLVQIGESCFNNCKLQSIVFGDKLEQVNKTAFEGCTSLQSVTWNNKIKIIQEFGFGKTGLEGEIELPSSLELLSIGVFSNCNKITSIRFSDDSNLSSVSTKAFSGSNNIKKITFGSKIAEIQIGTFLGTNGLTDIIISESNTNFRGLNGLVLSKNKSYLYSCACGLRSIEVPIEVIVIREKTFYGCQLLENVTFEGFNGKDKDKNIEGIKEISDSLFYECISLKQISIPRSVQRIKMNSFHGCISLSKVYISQNSTLLNIEDNSFFGCSSLESFVFEGDCFLERIGSKSFSGCSKLISFRFPPNLKEIGSEAFGGCFALETIKLPKEVEVLSDFSFRDCDKIRWIKFCGNLSIGSSKVFSEAAKKNIISVEVPSAYKGKEFCGMKVNKILDLDCNIATNRFTLLGEANGFESIGVVDALLIGYFSIEEDFPIESQISMGNREPTKAAFTKGIC